MHPLGTKTKSRNLLGKKIMEPPKKSRNLLVQKKSCSLLGQKLMAQPLGTKKACHLLGQKNHAISGQKKNATSWDKNNHATSWDKKNHAISQDKKIIQIGINRSNKIKYDVLWSNMVQYGLICKKKKIIINLIGCRPLNPGSPGSSFLKVNYILGCMCEKFTFLF